MGQRQRAARRAARVAAPRRRERHLAAGTLLVGLIVLAYLPALWGGFVWDDDAYVTRNTALRSLGGLAAIWFQPGAVPQYYPLTFTSLWVDYRLWGLQPSGYHLVNVALHALAAVLLWRVLVLLRLPAAWAAAAVFALHPVQVESVVWIAERKNVLAGVCALGALLAYLRFTDEPPDRRRGWYALSLGLFVAALLAKTVTCSLPAVICLIVWWRRGALRAADVAPLLPYFALGAGLGAVTLWMERHHVGAAGTDWHLSWLERGLIAGRALWFYAASIVWPRNLTFIYPRWQIDAAVWWQYLYPAGAFAVVAVLYAVRRRIGRGPLVGVLIFAGTLLPALGFFDVFPMRYSFVADHYQYLASIGLIVLLVVGVARLCERTGARAVRGGSALLGVVLVVFTALVWRQAIIYRDAETLWRDTLAKNPSAWMAHNNLGLLLFNRGRVDEAITHYQAALSIKRDDDFAYNNLGNAFAAQGDMERAERSFAAALALQPSNAEAHNNLGNVHASREQWLQAAEQYRAALRANPRYADAHNNLANVLVLDGDAEAALEHYRAALQIDPAYADAHYNLAVLLADRGDTAAAVTELRAALRLRPNYPQARARLDALIGLPHREP